MKKKNGDKQDIIWPVSSKVVKKEPPLGHHQHPEEPGGDHHHAHDEARIKESKRVWDEKHRHDLPPKSKGKKPSA